MDMKNCPVGVCKFLVDDRDMDEKIKYCTCRIDNKQCNFYTHIKIKGSCRNWAYLTCYECPIDIYCDCGNNLCYIGGDQ